MAVGAGSDIRIFTLGPTEALGSQVATRLGVTLARHEERVFEDGEHKIRTLENVRGKDVYVLTSLHGTRSESVHDQLCRCLFFLGGLKDAGAGRLTAMIPYLCYARKDRRTKPFDPVTTRYVAALFEAVGLDRIVTLDVHNPAAYENAFRVETGLLEARPRLVAHVASLLSGSEKTAVVAPDAGAMKRAEAFREALERHLGRPVTIALMEKQRSEGRVTGTAFAGDVEGANAVIVDDLIASGTTLLRAAEACRARGSRRVIAAATHGVFTAETARVLGAHALERVVVTDSVQPLRVEAPLAAKLAVLPLAPLLSEAIRRLHEDAPLDPLSDIGPVS